jgi:hypothetical protein
VRRRGNPKDIEVARATLNPFPSRRRRGDPFFRRWSIDDVVEQWDALVWRIEAGYPGQIEDYWADMVIRDRLESLLSALPRGALLAAITARIAGIDAHFTDVTNQGSKPISVDGDKSWWWWRVPSNLPGDLGRDLRREGWIDF